MRADGVYLWDSEGKKIIDGMAGLCACRSAYGNKELADAGCEALHTLPYYNHFFKTTNPYTTELAAKLATFLPGGHNHVLFANSGSEANDTALKLIRYYWNLKKKPDKKIHLSRDHGLSRRDDGGGVRSPASRRCIRSSICRSRDSRKCQRLTGSVRRKPGTAMWHRKNSAR